GPDDDITLDSMHKLAASYEAVGRHAEALKIREDTLARRKAALGPEDPRTLMSMSALACSYIVLGRQAEALALRREAITLREKRVTKYPGDFANRVELGGLHGTLGNALRRNAQSTESLTAYARALEQLQTVLRKEPDVAVTKLYLRNAHLGRALAHEELKRH